MRPVLYFEERKRIKEIERTISTTLRLAARCKKEGYSDTLTIANATLYLLIAELDIALVKVDAFTHPNEWKRKLCIRFLILTVFEWKIHHIFGRNFQHSVKNLGCSPQLIETLTKNLKSFRKSHEKLRYNLKYYRDETIAHRSPDAIETHLQIARINESEILDSIAQLYSSIKPVLECLTTILLQYGNVEAHIKFTASQHNA